MAIEPLTWRSVDTRAVRVPLRRPVVSKVGTFDTWPLILIDLHTREGVTGRSYLEPYLDGAARYVKPAIEDLAALRAGSPLQPLSDFQENRRALQLVGYEGVAMIAVAGLDMAAWDAVAQAAGLPPACSAAAPALSPPTTATASGSERRLGNWERKPASWWRKEQAEASSCGWAASAWTTTSSRSARCGRPWVPT